MPNLISTNYPTNIYLNSRQKEREERPFGPESGRPADMAERAEMLRKEREEEKKAAQAEKDQPEKNDYRSLVDRVAEQEAKKAKLSGYTSRQQELLKQVEDTITPDNNERSYNLKV